MEIKATYFESGVLWLVTWWQFICYQKGVIQVADYQVANKRIDTVWVK